MYYDSVFNLCSSEADISDDFNSYRDSVLEIMDDIQD